MWPMQVLHRAHTREAPVEHRAAGGEAWDTVKPLGRHFSNMHRVLLVDDDAFKVHDRVAPAFSAKW